MASRSTRRSAIAPPMNPDAPVIRTVMRKSDDKGGKRPRGRTLRSLKSTEAFRSFVLDQLEEIGDVTPRSMFGGVGLYHRGVFFGIIARDVLYLKVDEGNRSDYTRAASALARQRVNIRSVAGLAIDTYVTIRIIADDVEAARTALESSNIRYEEGEVVQVMLENRAGELAVISNKLAEGGVNLRAIYLTGIAGDLVELAIVPDDAKKAKRLL